MEGCCCRGGRLRGFIQPRVLLQLAQKPVHGYELIDIINEDDELGTDPGSLYRLLCGMEENRLVESSWDTSGGSHFHHHFQTNAEQIADLESYLVELSVVDGDQRRVADWKALLCG